MLQMSDVIKVLSAEIPPKDLEKKSVKLAGLILEMMKKAKKRSGEKLALEILKSGQAFEKFKALADKKKDVYDEDIEAILDDQLESGRALWELVRFQVTSGTGVIATGTELLPVVYAEDVALSRNVTFDADGTGPLTVTGAFDARLLLAVYETRTSQRPAPGSSALNVADFCPLPEFSS
jgi:hypothetical protein